METKDSVKEELYKVALYTDGGAEPNPGKGGIGVVLICNGKFLELSKGFKFTTNNRMELQAVISGLMALKKKSRVTVYSDSQYVVNGFEKGWVLKWNANNWMRKTGQVVNSDLWKQLLTLTTEHVVRFQWIKGHNGHQQNERCDELALMALSRPDLEEDEGYIPLDQLEKNIDKLRST